MQVRGARMHIGWLPLVSLLPLMQLSVQERQDSAGLKQPIATKQRHVAKIETMPRLVLSFAESFEARALAVLPCFPLSGYFCHSESGTKATSDDDNMQQPCYSRHSRVGPHSHLT